MLDERVQVGQVERLDAYHMTELGCDQALLDIHGVHVISSERRNRPGWGGYTVPILAISTSTGGIISVRPELLDRVRRALATIEIGRPIGADDFERLRQVSRTAIPYAYSLSGYVLYNDAEHFRPVPSRAEHLSRSDPRASDLYRRFDGEVFAVRGQRGEIASWAAIKLKSADVWEIAVVTESPYRGQGLAKEVVSAATAYILGQDRLAVYVHDRTNLASGRVCRSLGYIEYTEEFFSEY